jgi:hypothetical protein
MDLPDVFDSVPDPRSYSIPDYSLPSGDPVLPIALTGAELDALLALYDQFANVDPTGIESNPFLKATVDSFQQTFGVTSARPDEQLVDDIGDMLTTFSAELGDKEIGVVDATPVHHRTLYLFLTTTKGYHAAPHITFDPDPDAVETLFEVFERVADQNVYLKRPRNVLE